jgi:hypothetical protein
MGVIIMNDRVKFDLYVDLDNMPGAFHTVEDARYALAKLLKDQIPHYHPQVTLPNAPEQIEAEINLDQSNDSWSRNPQVIALWLQSVMNYLQMTLAQQGHLFLNEVHDAVGVPRTSQGARAGWSTKGGLPAHDFKYNIDQFEDKVIITLNPMNNIIGELE